MAVTLSFNKSAARIFGDTDTPGLRIRVDDGKLEMKPVSEPRGADLKLSEQGRGGYSAVIEGPLAERIATETRLDVKGGFFALHPEARGWLTPTPVRKPLTPRLRFEGLLRITSKDTTKMRGDGAAPRRRRAAAEATETTSLQGLPQLVERAVEEGLNRFAARLLGGAAPAGGTVRRRRRAAAAVEEQAPARKRKARRARTKKTEDQPVVRRRSARKQAAEKAEKAEKAPRGRRRRGEESAPAAQPHDAAADGRRGEVAAAFDHASQSLGVAAEA